MLFLLHTAAASEIFARGCICRTIKTDWKPFLVLCNNRLHIINSYIILINECQINIPISAPNSLQPGPWTQTCKRPPPILRLFVLVQCLCVVICVFLWSFCVSLVILLPRVLVLCIFVDILRLFVIILCLFVVVLCAFKLILRHSVVIPGSGSAPGPTSIHDANKPTTYHLRTLVGGRSDSMRGPVQPLWPQPQFLWTHL